MPVLTTDQEYELIDRLRKLKDEFDKIVWDADKCFLTVEIDVINRTGYGVRNRPILNLKLVKETKI